MTKCAWHLCENELSGRQKKFCSGKCKNKFNVDKRRKKLKDISLEYKGGKCIICNYDRCKQALEFHHTDPETKEFALAETGSTKSWDSIKKELDKCVLVCNRCHREIHSDLVSPEFEQVSD